MRHWRAFLPSVSLVIWAIGLEAGCHWTWAWFLMFTGTVCVCVYELAGRYKA